MQRYLIGERVLYYYETWKTISQFLGMNEQSYLIRLFVDDTIKMELMRGKNLEYFTISNQAYVIRKMVKCEFIREEAIRLEGVSMFNKGKKVIGRVLIIRDDKKISIEVESDINKGTKKQYEITDVKCKVGGYQKGEEHLRNRYDPNYDGIFDVYMYESSESSSSSDYGSDWESSVSSSDSSSDSDDLFETKPISKRPR